MTNASTMTTAPAVRHIDETRLETDLAYRFGFVSEFMMFDESDIAAIHDAAEYLAPAVPVLVDAVYEKLFQYDATKRHFLKRGANYNGPTAEQLEELTLDDEQIQFRKQHLTNYLVRLVTDDYDEKLLAYLDLVGQIHTPEAGSPKVAIPLVQMNALMGFVSDALTTTILGLGLDRDKEVRTLRAFGKLLWIQNDLIARHYQR